MTNAAENLDPIACTLAAGDYGERVRWIAALNADALRGHRRDDLRLVLTYQPSATAQVAGMVASEKECCAFLDFDLRSDVDAITVTITVPERARETAETLFAPFLPGNTTPATCACDGGAAA